MSIKRIIIIILVLLLTPIGVFAYRTSRPIKFTDLTKPDQINQLNEIITELWNISNGKISFTSGATASSGTGTIKMGSVSSANSAGFIKAEKDDGTIIYIPYFTDDTP